MNFHDILLTEIENFLAARKMAASTFGRLAVNDGKLVARVRSGANLTLSTVERIRAFIASHPSYADEDAA